MVILSVAMSYLSSGFHILPLNAYLFTIIGVKYLLKKEKALKAIYLCASGWSNFAYAPCKLLDTCCWVFLNALNLLLPASHSLSVTSSLSLICPSIVSYASINDISVPLFSLTFCLYIIPPANCKDASTSIIFLGEYNHFIFAASDITDLELELPIFSSNLPWIKSNNSINCKLWDLGPLV